MNRKELAEEIRGVGFALRYADGPVIGGSLKREKPVGKQIQTRKLKESDGVTVRRASRCSTCNAVASKADIEITEAMADNYQGFARMIWPCIEHKPRCHAMPYIPVSEKAKTKFAKARAKRTKKIEKKAEKQATKSTKKKPRPGGK